MAYANQEQSDEERKHFLDEALQLYEQAIQKKSNLASAYYGEAVVYERMANYDQAIENINKAVAAAPNSINYLYEAGRMLFNRGIVNVSSKNDSQIAAPPIDATTDTQTADNELSANQNTSNTRGNVSMNDDLRAATTIFNQIIAANPQHANATYSLALIYEITGDTANAKKYYEKLVDIVPDQVTKDAILQKLSTL